LSADGTVALRGGRPGSVFMTADVYLSSDEAQDRLSLPDAPQVAVAFLVTPDFSLSSVPPESKNAFGPNRPPFDTSGGGSQAILPPSMAVPLYVWQLG
jgi:hypothetical protein